jgi:SET family sugar efflux transporter-like MFS transporter
VVGADKRVGGASGALVVFTALCALVVSGQAIKNTYLPIDVTVHLGGSMSAYGTIVAVSPIVELVVMPLSGMLAHEIGLGLLIATGILLAVVEYLVLTVSTMIWQFYVTQAMDACVVAVIMGLGMTYAQRLSPGRPGAANGIFFSCFNIAFVLGGLIGSASVPLLGVPHIFLIPVLLCTVAWIGFLLIERTNGAAAR